MHPRTFLTGLVTIALTRRSKEGTVRIKHREPDRATLYWD